MLGKAVRSPVDLLKTFLPFFNGVLRIFLSDALRFRNGFFIKAAEVSFKIVNLKLRELEKGSNK